MLNLLSKHSALMVMAATSAIFFLSNVVIKNEYGSDEYAAFSLFFLYFTLLSSVGVLSVENLMLRYVEVQNRRVLIPSWVLKRCAIAFFLGMFLFPVAGFLYYLGGQNFWLSLVMYVSMFFSVIFSTLLRLTKRFFVAQLIVNSWRWFLSPIIIVFYLVSLEIDDLGFVELFSFFGMLLVSFFAFWCFLKGSVEIVGREDVSTQDANKAQLGFLSSVLLLVVLSSIDKFVIEDQFSVVVFSNYSYMFMMLTFSSFMFSSYLGYKELVYFKSRSDYNLNTGLFRFFLLSTLVYMLNFAVIYLLNAVLQVELMWSLVSLLYLYTVLKSTYSLLSSVVGAKANAKEILHVNILSWLVIGVASVTAFYGIEFSSIEQVLGLGVLLWLTRWVLFYRCCLGVFKNVA